MLPWRSVSYACFVPAPVTGARVYLKAVEASADARCGRVAGADLHGHGRCGAPPLRLPRAGRAAEAEHVSRARTRKKERGTYAACCCFPSCSWRSVSQHTICGARQLHSRRALARHSRPAAPAWRRPRWRAGPWSAGPSRTAGIAPAPRRRRAGTGRRGIAEAAVSRPARQPAPRPATAHTFMVNILRNRNWPPMAMPSIERNTALVQCCARSRASLSAARRGVRQLAPCLHQAAHVDAHIHPAARRHDVQRDLRVHRRRPVREA